MSDQITVTNPDSTTELFNVYYSVENRQKRIEWVTGGTGNGFANVNKLYSALQDLFDEIGQMDDGVPMSAQTPTEYTIGTIDSGDSDPWFIDRVSVEHLTGGAIKTSGWTRAASGNVGILRITCNNGAGGGPGPIDSGDIGDDVSLGGNNGTLLDVKGTGAGSTLWIRPDTSGDDDDWDDAGTITAATSTNTATWTSTSTGESLWANIFSIGTIETNTHIYVRQDSDAAGTTPTLLVGYKSATDWWVDGHIDILVNVKEVDLEVDDGITQVFARQHTKTYDHFETDLSSGGRNPIPLSTGNDLDNQVGYWQTVITTGPTGNFTVGEVIRIDGQPASAERGIVTSSTGTAPDITLQYYSFGDPIDNFDNGDVIYGETSTQTATVVTPTAVNGASYTDVTIDFGQATYDVNENDTTERYSIVIDGAGRTLLEIYRRLKYITRRGEATITLGEGSTPVPGQFYIGSDRRITYNTLTGSLVAGDFVTQAAAGGVGPAEGYVVAIHDSGTKRLIIRNTEGTFNTTNDIQKDGSNKVSMTGGSIAVISPVKASPFGTYAGGKFFGAPGVVLTDINSADVSNYQLIDDDNNVVKPPTKVSLSIANTRQDDKVAIFRLGSGVIEKDYYTVDAAGAIGGTAITITATPAGIRVNEPGKTTGGVLRLVDDSGDKEYRIRFASWTGSIFTLDTQQSGGVDFTLQAASDTDTLVSAAGEFTTNKVGDIIINTTQSNSVHYVVEKTDNQTLQISPAFASDPDTDTIYINAIPVVLEVGVDTVYVPFIDVFETTGADPLGDTESATVTFDEGEPTVSIRVVARHADIPANYGIIPYSADTSFGSSNFTNSIIRTGDTIFTP